MELKPCPFCGSLSVFYKETKSQNVMHIIIIIVILNVVTVEHVALNS